jgi:magnesium-transporting ATPase (P-type)
MDPLREKVTEAVRRIIDSGAKVMMITGLIYYILILYILSAAKGDAEATAVSIAKLAGISDSEIQSISYSAFLSTVFSFFIYFIYF